MTQTVDPLGGSYFVEQLTDEMEGRIRDILEQIEGLGGVLPAIERGYFRRRITESAYAEQKRIDAGQKTIVGVTEFQESAEPHDNVLQIAPDIDAEQIRRLQALRANETPRDMPKPWQPWQRTPEPTKCDAGADPSRPGRRHAG